jgi:hypothetical protein
VRVTLRDDGEDGELGLDGEVEGALLEGEEVGLVEARASSLREDPDSRLKRRVTKKRGTIPEIPKVKNVRNLSRLSERCFVRSSLVVVDIRCAFSCRQQLGWWTRWPSCDSCDQ